MSPEAKSGIRNIALLLVVAGLWFWAGYKVGYMRGTEKALTAASQECARILYDLLNPTPKQEQKQNVYPPPEKRVIEL